ncbi:hypothetical protein RJ641_033837 [Dillenia turbinata]|uniref:Uncharacterized protein n=1 Tax=Dillenia turbinata TaxID=194707 RepID=A0AAN8W0E6_9MAGN
MATQIGEIIQDQNANFQYSGVGASVGTKAKISATQKKGGLGGGRKALNDLTNSAKHPSHQALNKPKKSVSIFGDGFGTLHSAGGKTSSIKAKTRGKAPNGGRKALSDLTNSSKPSLTEAPMKDLSKKLNAVAEEDCAILEAIEEEGFLHNHKDCIKGNRKGLDLKSFLEIVGLDDGILKKDLASSEAIPKDKNPEPEGPASYLEWEEISVPEYPYPESTLKSPSPWSSPPESPPNRWKLMDYEPDFTLIESPIKLSRGKNDRVTPALSLLGRLKVIDQELTLEVGSHTPVHIRNLNNGMIRLSSCVSQTAPPIKRMQAQAKSMSQTAQYEK